MGMSSSVYGLLDVKDKEMEKIKIVIENCHDLGVNVPEKILKKLDELGLDEYDFESGEISVNIPKREYNAGGENGFEIDVNKIPKNVKIIRFVNSY